MKCCTKCNIEKDDGEYRSGRNDCRLCERQQNKQYYQNNKEVIKKQHKQYRQNNKEAIKKRDKQYYQNNVEVIDRKKQEYRIKNPQVKMLADAKRRAKEKNVPFSIKKEDIFISEVCPILGIPLERAVGKKTGSPNSPSLDRIIPEKGYVKGNIIIISNKANMMKSDATPEEMIKLGEFGKKLLEEAKKNE